MIVLTPPLDAWCRLVAAAATTALVASAVYWTYWNVDQAFYLDGTIAFYYVDTGYEFLRAPRGSVPSWLAFYWLHSG